MSQPAAPDDFEPPVGLYVPGDPRERPAAGGPMRCDRDLDGCTYRCPCGASVRPREGDSAGARGWLDAHRPHTDGTLLEHTTADGDRAFAAPQPDRVVPL